MNTIEINDQLREEFRCFIGTFAMDELPKKIIKERPIGLIINLDPRDKPGSHWVALHIDENFSANYFDSFGNPSIDEHILQFLSINKVKIIKYNRRILQSFDSITCGAYCVIFIRMLCNGFTLREFLSIFDRNTKMNDKLVIKFLE